MTPFSLLCSLAGLSRREVERFLEVSDSSIDSWTSGRRNPHQENMDRLANLILAQDAAASQHAGLIAEQVAANPGLAFVEIGYPADDHEARSLGFPCVGAWKAMAARVVALAPVPVRLVPRGSTIATAAATDAHGR